MDDAVFVKSDARTLLLAYAKKAAPSGRRTIAVKLHRHDDPVVSVWWNNVIDNAFSIDVACERLWKQGSAAYQAVTKKQQVLLYDLPGKPLKRREKNRCGRDRERGHHHDLIDSPDNVVADARGDVGFIHETRLEVPVAQCLAEWKVHLAVPPL